MKQVQAFLYEGNAAAACTRMDALLKQHPDKFEAAAAALFKLLETAWTSDFKIKPVAEFLEIAQVELPAAAVDALAPLTPRVERVRAWTEQLAGVTSERLVREVVRHVVLKQLKEAAGRITALVTRTAGTPRHDEMCHILGQALADMRQDRERVQSVLGAVARAEGAAGQGGRRVLDVFSQACLQGNASGLQSNSQAMQRELTQAIVGLRKYVPGDGEVGEPQPEQLDRFFEETHAILAAALGEGDLEGFIDALTILKDYCPCDPRAVENLAGVEDRIFLQLGPKGKLVAVRTMRRLGELPTLRRAVLRLAQADKEAQRTDLLAAAMGGLGHAEFTAYLSAALRRAQTEREEGLLVEAMGRIGDPAGAELLLERLQVCVKNMREPAYERRGMQILMALGRLTRLRGLDPAVRNKIVQRVVKLTDATPRQFAFEAANQMFSLRLGELDPQLREWAVEKAVDAMWGQPPKGAQAAPMGNVNGWREPMVQTLLRLGEGHLPELKQSAQKFVTNYSGAMGALAFVLGEIGNPTCLDLIEAMVRTALMHDEQSDGPSYLLQEQVLDVASGQMVGLDRDDLIHTLLYTAKKIGGPAGVKLVCSISDQVQTGRVASPGDKTTSFLVETKMEAGNFGQIDHGEAQAEPAVDEKEFKKALSAASGGLFTKKTEQVAAIAVLGQAKNIDAVPVLVELLGNKDSMVAGAAHTALAQFMTPLPTEARFGEFIERFLSVPKHLKAKGLEAVRTFIGREMPKNPPYDRLFERQIFVSIEDEELAFQLKSAFAARPAAPVKSAPAGEEATGAAAGGGKPGGGAVLSELDKKREYMQARRAWIDSGKKGPPPEPPQ